MFLSRESARAGVAPMAARVGLPRSMVLPGSDSYASEGCLEAIWAIFRARLSRCGLFAVEDSELSHGPILRHPGRSHRRAGDSPYPTGDEPHTVGAGSGRQAPRHLRL